MPETWLVLWLALRRAACHKTWKFSLKLNGLVISRVPDTHSQAPVVVSRLREIYTTMRRLAWSRFVPSSDVVSALPSDISKDYRA